MTVIIVQARMGSTRLPGKVLKPVLGRPLLAFLVERLKRVRGADRLVIATTTSALDEPIVAFCQKGDIDYFRGSEEDVLSRYNQAAKAFRAETIVRITADCPLIDPFVIDRIIAHKVGVDYVSNTLVNTFPRGMDTEVFSIQALQAAQNEAKLPSEREHVTPFIYQHPERFRLLNIPYTTPQSHHRWTVDTPEDLTLVTKILEALYPIDPTFTLEAILKLVSQHPDWSQINAHIVQRQISNEGSSKLSG